MAVDFIKERQFEMKLTEIYHQFDYLSELISLKDFLLLFPLQYKNGKLTKLDKPAEFDLDRDIYLKVLVAFRETFT